MTKKKILIVEDNQGDSYAITQFLKKSFACDITHTESLSVARSLLLGNMEFDIIVIDSMLKGFEQGGLGIALIPVIREGLSKNAILLRFSKHEASLKEAQTHGIKTFDPKILTGEFGLFNEHCYLITE